MKSLRHLIVITIMTCYVSACSTLPLKPAKVNVSVAENTHLKYEGKGAGASAMLMSTMGPAGIAVGIAIDVGIGKDINKAYIEAGGQFEYIAQTKILNKLQLYCKKNSAKPICNPHSAVHIIVKEFGFKWTDNTNKPWIVATLNYTTLMKPLLLRSSELAELKDIEFASLEALKENGKITEQQLANTLSELALKALLVP